MQPPSLKEDILNGLIKSYSTEIPFDEGEPYSCLNKMSTFLDVANFEEYFLYSEQLYINKRHNAPHFETALELWIKEIESTIGDAETYLSNYYYDTVESEFSIMCSYAFWETTKGNTIYLRSIADKLLVQDENDLEFRYKLKESLFKAIAKGTVYAYILPRLKKELSDLNNKKIGDFSNEPNKESDESIKPLSANSNILKWIGSPSQFGFIIDLLIQGGYIEKPRSSFTKDAELYLKLFEIDATQGTLAKELSEKTNSLSVLNRNKFKIPDRSKLS